MKNLLVSLVFMVSLAPAHAQEEHKAQLLMQPASWEFERFNLPPAFAPGITYKGAEELRFAPGMFNKDSANYFTYAFVVQLDNIPAISQTEVREYLFKYYKGLCKVTANDRKLVIDTSQVTVAVEKQKDMPETIYNASANIFGVFADGAPVRLNMEIKVLPDTANKRTYLLIIASPREKKDAIWKTLYQIQKEFRIPG